MIEQFIFEAADDSDSAAICQLLPDANLPHICL